MTNFMGFIIFIIFSFQANAYIIKCQEKSPTLIICNMYVAENEQPLVGYIKITRLSSMEDEINIERLSINKIFRKRGLSFLLLSVGIASAKIHWKFDKILLMDASTVRSETGKPFYERFGFTCEANKYQPELLFCEIKLKDFISKRENTNRWINNGYLITKILLSNKNK